MRVLALDTALEACSVAVTDGGRALAVLSEPMVRGHQERLGGMVAEAMAQARLAFADLDRIAVTVGPGSFTGLRVGLAFAKGLSLALGVPCLGVGVLEALAASEARDGLTVCALDARRGLVHLQLFQAGAPLGPPRTLPLEAARAEVAALTAAQAIRFAGEAQALLSSGEPAPPRIDPLVLARIAQRWDGPVPRPEPLYLRAPDARTLAERGIGCRAGA